MEIKKIKKRQWKLFLFILYLVIVTIGICSITVVRPIGGSIWRLVTGEYSVEEAKQTIEIALTDELTYHDYMIELNGYRENLLGTRVIFKDDIAIVKSYSDSLVDTKVKIENEDVFSSAELIKKLYIISEENGAEFLYCAAPRKELYTELPENVPNAFLENYQSLLGSFEKLNIPYIDLANSLENVDCATSELFYYTDHHWTSYAGFLANNAICKELKERYSFNYNEKYCDLNQYMIKKYDNIFLGSKGKKVGAHFTEHGADDFELIVPRFKTSLIEEQPFKNEIREGVFEDTVLYMENLKKDYYNVNTYATYSGGDFRLQIMKNNLNKDGKKILLIRDSFACVVTPFLALQSSELHICDVRDGSYYVGDKLNMEQYIKEIKPDYVMVLYTDVDEPTSSRYNFF